MRKTTPNNIISTLLKTSHKKAPKRKKKSPPIKRERDKDDGDFL